MIPKIKDPKFRDLLLDLRAGLDAPKGKIVSQEKVARKAGISVTAYQTAESGVIPGYAVLTKLSKFFNTPKETLLNPPDNEPLINKDREREGGGGIPTPARPRSIEQPIGFEASHVLKMAARVIASNTSYAQALYLNIIHFDRATQAEERLNHLENRVRSLEQTLAGAQGRPQGHREPKVICGPDVSTGGLWA